MWVKIKDGEGITHIDTNKVMCVMKCKMGDKEAVVIDTGTPSRVIIFRDTEAEIDQIIQALIVEETIKEVE